MDSTAIDQPGDVNTLAAGTLIARRYRIISPLGAGGMGAVYLAADKVLGDEKIAIKILHRGFVHDKVQLARFLREVQLMRKVNHKNVVRTYDVGTDGDYNYFTMEVVPGVQLEKLIANRSITSERLADYVVQICEALEAVHHAGIIHRDLKPGNVLVLEDETLRITDFGVARPEISNLTAHDEIVGSVCYIAPEIWLGKKITPSVDLYSLGIIAYEMATGTVPFDGESPAVLMRAHLDRAPVPPKELNRNLQPWLNKLILRLLAKSPADRPRDAREVIDYVRLHSNSHTPEQNASRASLQPFMEELEAKSQILMKTNEQQHRVDGSTGQTNLSVVRRVVNSSRDSSSNHPVVRGGNVAADLSYRVFLSIGLLGLLGAIAATLQYFLITLLPGLPVLKNSFVEQNDALPNLSIAAVATFGIPHIFLTACQLAVPALLIGSAAGDRLQALQVYAKAVILLGLFYLAFVGYYLLSLPSAAHWSGISILSALNTAKDQVGAVALFSPIITVYEQVVLGNALVQNPTALAPLAKNSLGMVCFLMYVALILRCVSQLERQARGEISKLYLLLGAALVCLIVIEGSMLEELPVRSWMSFAQFSTRLPPAALTSGALHWMLVFVVCVLATLRPGERKRPRRRGASPRRNM